MEVVKEYLKHAFRVVTGRQKALDKLLFRALYFEGGSDDTVRTLLENGANVNHRSKFGSIPLLNAASGHCSTNALKMLLKAGAKVNHCNDFGQTALSNAAGSGPRAEEKVRILLEHGAYVDAQDQYGQTALMNAAQDGYTNIVTMLLEAGANQNQKNKDGKTAMDLANDRHRPEMAEYIQNWTREKTDTPYHSVNIENAPFVMERLKEKFRNAAVYDEHADQITVGNLVARRNVEGLHDAPDGWQFHTKAGEWRGFLRDSSTQAAIEEMAFQEARDEMMLAFQVALRPLAPNRKDSNSLSFGLAI